MNHGSCQWGSTQFTVSGELHSARYCYCVNCTKFCDTSPATWVIVESSKLGVDSSGNGITKFNSGRGLRCFCTNCGSPVWFESLDYPQIVAIPLGVLDDGDIPVPEMHIWTQSKPSWGTTNDNLPQHNTYP